MKRGKLTVTRTRELIIAPQVLVFAGRRYLGAVAAISVLVAMAFFAVRRLSSLEEMLAAEGVHAARVVVYELANGTELRAPIEPKTDVLRFVVHAYRRGDRELELAPRRAQLQIVIAGERAHRTERLDVEAPGERTRVTTNEDGLSLGDPVAFDVDVHEAGVGDVAVTLLDTSGADGLLVRVYHREQLSTVEANLREAGLDHAKKERLARWTWETGWDELSKAERHAIVGTRWHRLGALRGGGRELRSVAIAQSPRAAHETPAPSDALLGRVALRGDERIAFMLHGGEVMASSDSVATLRATVRHEHGEAESVEGAGVLAIRCADGEVVGVELSSDRDALVDVRAADPERVSWLATVHAWRATRSRPIVVESPEADRVVRVSVRRPMDRRDGAVGTIAASLEVTTAGAPPSVRALQAQRQRSRFDRYESLDPLDAPSERLVAYVALPRGSVLRFLPSDETPLDVSLSELDARAPAEPLIARPVDAPPASVKLEGEQIWPGFVSRRPSNANVFEVEDRIVVRTARRWVPHAPPATVPNLARVRHSSGARVERGGRAFEAIGQTFQVELAAVRPLVLPMVFAADQDAVLSVTLEPASSQPLRAGARARARAGVFDRLTLKRTIRLSAGDSRASYVIGDDLPPGKYKLAITSPQNADAKVMVHMPWFGPHRSTGPRWIAGQFEE